MERNLVATIKGAAFGLAGGKKGALTGAVVAHIADLIAQNFISIDALIAEEMELFEKRVAAAKKAKQNKKLIENLKSKQKELQNHIKELKEQNSNLINQIAMPDENDLPEYESSTEEVDDWGLECLDDTEDDV